jgi:hypothetical protein
VPENEKDGEGGGVKRPARVPRLDYNKNGREDPVLLQDVQEGDEAEADSLNDEPELNIIRQDDNDGSNIETEGPPPFEDVVGVEETPVGVFTSLMPSIAATKGQTDAALQLPGADMATSTNQKAIVPPTSSSSAAMEGAVGPVQGNAAAAARSLRDRDRDKDQKQQSIEYISK